MVGGGPGGSRTCAHDVEYRAEYQSCSDAYESGTARSDVHLSGMDFISLLKRTQFMVSRVVASMVGLDGSVVPRGCRVFSCRMGISLDSSQVTRALLKCSSWS
jgi:hypothetical protein